MTETNYLKAFWHRSRGEFVPLTGPEMDRKVGSTPEIRSRLVRSGYVRPSFSGDTRSGPTYDIQPSGIALLESKGIARVTA